MQKAYTHIFTYFKYSPFFGICLKAVYTQWFFMSLFGEVFIIAVSLQLSTRFVNAKHKIKRLSNTKVGVADFVNKHLLRVFFLR